MNLLTLFVLYVINSYGDGYTLNNFSLLGNGIERNDSNLGTLNTNKTLLNLTSTVQQVNKNREDQIENGEEDSDLNSFVNSYRKSDDSSQGLLNYLSPTQERLSKDSPYDNGGDSAKFKYAAPIRRETAEVWQALEEGPNVNNYPWNSGNYYSHDSTYPENEMIDYLDVPSNYEKENQNDSKLMNYSATNHPQYFQKNYHYNYYPSGDGDNTNQGTANSLRLHRRYNNKRKNRKSPCRLYLEFLNYAFKKLDEYDDDYSDNDELYLPEKNFREGSKPEKEEAYSKVAGPTFYVNNSGKISQLHSTANTIQNTIHTSSPLTTPGVITTSITNSQGSASQSKGPFYITYNIPSTTLQTTTEYSDDEKTTEGKTVTTETPTSTRKLTTKKYNNYSRPHTTTKGKTATTAPPTVTNTYKKTSTITPSPPPGTVRSTSILPITTTTTVQDSSTVTTPTEADCNDKVLPCPDTFNITYPLNGYCDKYVSCESGRAIRRTCSGGLHFNIITKSCDIPHNSFCSYVCPKSEGYFGIPGDCGGYFVCKNFQAEYRMCPPKMHWDEEQEICTFAEGSSCQMKCPEPNEVKPYKGNCRAYIVCMNSIPFYHKCPPHMSFDQEMQSCVPNSKSSCQNNPKLMTKMMNPNHLCKQVQLKMGSDSWCNNILAKNNDYDDDDEEFFEH